MKTNLAGELMRVRLVVEASTYVLASTIVLAAAVFSAFVVRGRVNRLDLVCRPQDQGLSHARRTGRSEPDGPSSLALIVLRRGLVRVAAADPGRPRDRHQGPWRSRSTTRPRPACATSTRFPRRSPARCCESRPGATPCRRPGQRGRDRRRGHATDHAGFHRRPHARRAEGRTLAAAERRDACRSRSAPDRGRARILAHELQRAETLAQHRRDLVKGSGQGEVRRRDQRSRAGERKGAARSPPQRARQRRGAAHPSLRQRYTSESRLLHPDPRAGDAAAS